MGNNVIYIFFCFNISELQVKGWTNRIKILIADIFCIVVIGVSGDEIKARQFMQEGSEYNGYILNFMLQMNSLVVTEPKGYTIETIHNYENTYCSVDDSSKENPDIIVIMDESFADIRDIGKVNTDIEVTPFYDNLFENTIKGKALTSVFGGGTPNSEYEFLTGNTMGFLPGGAIPYQEYVKEETASLVSLLKNYGYKCSVTHPYLSSGWMRTKVYPLLQFDDYSFLEAYPQKNIIREYVSDREMFEQIVKSYEMRDTSQRYFLFGVTMQNHGGYAYEGENYKTTVHLNEDMGDYPDVEQYLSLLHETDAALEYLISYFSSVDKPVVIVFYGDHLPKLNSEFYEKLHGSAFDSLNEQVKQYTVPFFIWANYDIEERNVGLTSINYLSSYVMEAAGLPLAPYQMFLKDTEEIIPAINSLGYYSKDEGQFKEIDDAVGKEAEAILKYQQIQYNGIFDKKNRSKVFFGTYN